MMGRTTITRDKRAGRKPRNYEQLKAFQWKKGVSGNPAGRPPKLGSIRNQIRNKLQEIIPCQLCQGVGQIVPSKTVTVAQAVQMLTPRGKIRGAITCPHCEGNKLDPQGRTFAEWIATQEIYKAAAGEDRAIENVIDQVDGRLPQTIDVDLQEKIPIHVLQEALEDADRA